MLKIWAELLIVLLSYVRPLNAISCRFFISSQLPSNLDVREGLLSAGNVSLAANGTQECFAMFKQCIAIWKYDPVRDGYADVLFQGCWKGNSNECEGNRCVAHSDIGSTYLKHSRYCCCSSSFCNDNFSYEYVPKPVPEVEMMIVDQVETDELTFAVAICASFFIVATLAMTYLLSRACSWSKSVLSLCSRDSDDKLLLSEVGGKDQDAKSKSIKLDDVKLTRVLYTGRYSTVWLAELKTDGSPVALKLYASGLQRYGLNEIRVLGLPLMKHENMVKYLASTDLTNEVREGQSVECWLLTEYLPYGSLMDYLSANTLSWDAMCKLASSVAKGVAYLHAEVCDGADSYKPAIAHRDINSRNVLVKPDGTCAICDFAFAVVLETLSQPAGRRDPSLAEVGTVRYMAPELLEGAANLRDPETTLKQLDVYALGLVLWEIVSRCEDVYALNAATAPPYDLPYGKDVSTNPSLEEMQRVVCKNKKRPSFPNAMYRPKGGPLHTLRELVEDCWDQDSDARITALCAQERLTELCTVSCPAGPMEGHEFGSALQQESPNSRNMRAEGVYILQPSFNGGSTTDTSQTDTSGFASVGLGSSDRGRSCASSLGYQTNRSLSSAQRLQQFESQHTESVEHPSSAQDSFDGREEGLSDQIAVQDETSTDHDSGVSFGSGARQLAKDAVYPLLLLRSARLCLRRSLTSEDVDECLTVSDHDDDGTADRAAIGRSRSPHVAISLPDTEADGTPPI